MARSARGRPRSAEREAALAAAREAGVAPPPLAGIDNSDEANAGAAAGSGYDAGRDAGGRVATA